MTRRGLFTLIPFAGGAVGLGSRLIEDSANAAPLAPAPCALSSSSLTITIRVEVGAEKLAAQLAEAGCIHQDLQAEAQGGGRVETCRPLAARPPGRRLQKYAV